jgi:hypothetical protein
MCVHALGLYNARYSIASQELFETIESDARSSATSRTVAQARLDLNALFRRDLERELVLGQLRDSTAALQAKSSNLSADLTKSIKRARRFQSFGAASLLLLVALIVTFAISQRAALIEVLTSAGSILGLVVGAIIAVPIAVWLVPRVSEPQFRNNDTDREALDDQR